MTSPTNTENPPPPSAQAAKGGASWAWGIAGLYAAFAFGMIALVVFCTTQRVDLVRPDYYQAGVNHQQRIDAESRALSLTEKPTVNKDANGNVVIAIPGTIESGTIGFYRPDNPVHDFQVPLVADGPTVVPPEGLVAGRWSLDLSWRADGKTYAVALPYHH